MLRELDIGRRPDTATVRSALKDGFFLVRNSVPEGLLDESYGLLESFFSLPAWQKEDARVPGSNGQSGYTPPLVETAEKSGSKPDWKELFHWGPLLPEGHPLRARYPARYPTPLLPDDLVPGIGKVLTELHTKMQEFQIRVVGVIAEALGVQPSYFEEMLHDGPVVNRAAWYPPMDIAPSPDYTWAVEHQDFDLITALPRATAPGLQVLLQDGEWLPVHAPEGYAVVNVGMVLERLTNGLARAAVHRVVAAPSQGAGRLSIVQFCHPTPWTVLTPLSLPDAPAIPRHPTLTADALFERTMYRINRLGM
ncbi:isopenicillin N synthase family oxygenase [Streptomyces sp. OF3]|uniref:Isopenicillin N synthase family oxygenase n=1 Tax=Streptomyces alkaliterrae TaxID=2213162 RepID=A0A7W3ZLS2_9ACTN|nr:isopenicillin N synthase family oxygenase [Streptomyces alkaliterrae]MBB1252597.1 isopenicillin N synthase family oxygenase [Streptomyces alkaliterrae]